MEQNNNKLIINNSWTSVFLLPLAKIPPAFFNTVRPFPWSSVSLGVLSIATDRMKRATMMTVKDESSDTDDKNDSDSDEKSDNDDMNDKKEPSKTHSSSKHFPSCQVCHAEVYGKTHNYRGTCCCPACFAGVRSRAAQVLVGKKAQLKDALQQQKEPERKQKETEK